MNLVQDILSIRNLLQNNTIGILLGERMNLDTAGAALGLYLSLKETGKNPQIISVKEPIVEIANLVGIDKVKKSFSGNSNRVVVSLPYNKGEIGKVSYKEENDRINFYLTAAGGRSITSYDTNDINLIWDGSMPDAIFVFGVNNPAQIASYMNSNNPVKIINVDNAGESFGDISIVNNAFSSVSEVVTKIIKELRLPISIDIAQNLLDGVLYGTRNFTKPNTSPYAFESAGILMQAGAVRVDNRNSGWGMFNQNKPSHQNQSRNNQNRNQNRPQQNQNIQVNQNLNRAEEAQGVVSKQADNNLPVEPNEPEAVQNQPADNQDIPDDWLMPKVFKGSQDIEDLK